MRTRALAVLLLLGTPVAGEELSPVALGRIDAHAHLFAEARPVLDVLDRSNLVAVNVCVVDRYDRGYETVAPQHAMARHLAELTRRLPWIATFDDAGFADTGFARGALAEVEKEAILAARDRVLERHPRLRFVGCHLGSMEYARDWAYFATDETLEVDGWKVEGLALPAPVLRQVFRENALRWVPGLAAAPPFRP